MAVRLVIGSQDGIYPALIALALGLHPVQYIGIQTQRHRLFPGRDFHLYRAQESFIELRDFAVVDIVIAHFVEPLQVALDRFLAHVYSPFSLI